MANINAVQAVLQLEELIKAGHLRRFFRITTENGIVGEYPTIADVPTQIETADGSLIPTLPCMLSVGYMFIKQGS